MSRKHCCKSNPVPSHGSACACMCPSTSCLAHCTGRFIWERESHGSTSHDIALHYVTWHNTKKRITLDDMTTTSHHITWHDTSQLTPFNTHHITSQATTLLPLTPQQTSRHQNRSHHHHGTSRPWNGRKLVHSKEWFGHRAARSPCAHSIFFLCYI